MHADLDRRFGLVILRSAEVVQDLGPRQGKAAGRRRTADQTWVRPSVHCQ